MSYSSNLSSPRKLKGDGADNGTRAQNGRSHHIHQEGWDSEIEGNFHVFEGTSCSEHF
ncbi:hypothetical protein OBBRIDRAFT_348444 [Obba rivulosa]|uniref:Uncharacterized protein n=1 Tax=Obba rivulosa TaxID=1052685 RepID=A0A8E2AI86_9APHY|nr:hypothetical protein OBBRIDRAFT_348444 [Obba rivulosa]